MVVVTPHSLIQELSDFLNISLLTCSNSNLNIKTHPTLLNVCQKFYNAKRNLKFKPTCEPCHSWQSHWLAPDNVLCHPDKSYSAEH